MSKYKREHVLWAIALALVAAAWGTSYAITKDAITMIKPFALMSLRFGISTIVLSLLFFGRLKKITRRELVSGLIIGTFMALAFLALSIGINYTTASKQCFLVGAYVLFVPFVAWAVYRKKPQGFDIAGAVMATIGIALLTLEGSLSLNKGDMITLLCAVFFACHLISIEYFKKHTDPIVLTIMQFAVTSVMFLALTGIFESFTFTITPRVAGSVVYLVVISTLIAFAVQNVAQKHLSSTSTALILTLETVFGSVFALFYLGETMTLKMVAGCAVIFMGILVQETRLEFLRLGNKKKRDSSL